MSPSQSSFASKYLQRLQLDPTKLDDQPTLSKLQTIVEAHLTKIPFENIAQHGGTGGKQTLDFEEVSSRVLDRNRGGFCYELNGLLGEFLEHELHYSVCRGLAIVGMPDENGTIQFNLPPLHMVLFCKVCDDDATYLVDVAFGEPSIHPLKYVYDVEQVTPENMASKLSIDEHGKVTLSWYQNGAWVPRLQWNHSATILDTDMSPKWNDPMFSDALSMVQHPDSIFTQKLVVCKISRTHKVTLAGTRLKITGPTRFPHISNATKEFDHILEEEKKEADDDIRAENISDSQDKKNCVIKDLETDMDVRMVLQEEFGIPLEETIGMDFTKSTQAPVEIWSQM